MNPSAFTKAILMTLALGAASCAQAEAEPNVNLPPKPERRSQPLPPRLVKPDAQASKARGLALTGRTRANRVSHIATMRPGLVDAVNFKAGDYVKKGAVLVRLDSVQARLQVKASQAALQTAQAQAAGALRERTRLEKVGGAVPTADVDRAVTASDIARAQVAQAEAGLALAKKNVADSAIRAPFSGLLLQSKANEGEWLNTMAGGVVAEFADVDPLEIALQAPEHMLGKINVEDEMEVRFAATGQTVTAKVRRIVRSVDPTTRSFEVVAEIPNADRELSPGLFAEAQLTKEVTP